MELYKTMPTPPTYNTNNAYSNWNNEIQQAINQFVGQKITPQLMNTIRYSLEVLVKNLDPYNKYSIDVSVGTHGQIQVNMKQAPFLGNATKFHPFSKRDSYSRHMGERWASKLEYIIFVHDPRDAWDANNKLDLNSYSFYLY